ncbi:hypothetical protein ACFL3H_06700 [Gemmatimonadota bacterium]
MKNLLLIEFMLLLKPKWYTLRNRARFRGEGDLTRSIILFVIIAIFWATIYLIFSNFLYQFKIVEEFGEILPGKLMAMIFLFFLGILMWSSLLTSFGVFFMSSDLQLLTTSPISDDALYLSRLFETVFNASWMVLLFALPVFIAYGVVFEGGVLYYLIVVVVNLSFVVIPAVLGVGLTMVLVNVFPARRAKDVLMIVSILFFAGLVLAFRILRPERLLDPDAFISLLDFFNAMRAPLSPVLPSQWASEAIASLLVGSFVYDPFYLGMLVISSMAAVVAGAWVSARTYHNGFTKTQEVRRTRLSHAPFIDRLINVYAFFFPRQLKQIISKDVKSFLRDITQWSQIFLLMALVVIYVYNFRALPLAGTYMPTVYMTNLVSFLNLGLAGFVVAAVAARFVFPAVSLEGNAFWLIRSSPLGLKGFLWSKFWISFFPLLILGEALIVITSLFLGTHPVIRLVGIVTIFFITLAITGLGIGVGAAYPRFNWENVAKIPTGFGGIVFMVLSITMVGVVVVIEWGPVYSVLISVTRGWPLIQAQWVSVAVSGLFVLLLCVFCFIVPMEIGLRRLEEREIW